MQDVSGGGGGGGDGGGDDAASTGTGITAAVSLNGGQQFSEAVEAIVVDYDEDDADDDAA